VVEKGTVTLLAEYSLVLVEGLSFGVGDSQAGGGAIIIIGGGEI
jgi:hypothetical protein